MHPPSSHLLTGRLNGGATFCSGILSGWIEMLLMLVVLENANIIINEN